VVCRIFAYIFSSQDFDEKSMVVFNVYIYNTINIMRRPSNVTTS
jgi:hypothetical protein